MRFLDQGDLLGVLPDGLRGCYRLGYGHVEVGQGADLAFEILVIGFAGLPLDAQVLHQLPQCGGEHDDAAGVVLLLAHDLGAYPHHEQPGLLPVRPDVSDALARGRHGLRVEHVGSAAVDAHPFGCVRPGVADGQGYAAEVGHQVDPALPVELLPLRPAYGPRNLIGEFFHKEVYSLLLSFVPRSVPGKRRFFILNLIHLRSCGSC